MAADVAAARLQLQESPSPLPASSSLLLPLLVLLCSIFVGTAAGSLVRSFAGYIYFYTRHSRNNRVCGIHAFQ